LQSSEQLVVLRALEDGASRLVDADLDSHEGVEQRNDGRVELGVVLLTLVEDSNELHWASGRDMDSFSSEYPADSVDVASTRANKNIARRDRRPAQTLLRSRHSDLREQVGSGELGEDVCIELVVLDERGADRLRPVRASDKGDGDALRHFVLSRGLQR
jgi:hypothetical protein